ncbi:MAG: energy-coupling factor transporter ATPase [Lachnospiraceae bacterium]|nr:energy-coupling factor transporter ATPase [Lachnospiraceae bacterium]
MEAVKGSGISFRYEWDGSAPFVLDGLSIAIEKGQFVAILGPNGCGKSTLAKHLNALLPLQSGSLTVAGLDVREEKQVWELRRLCGMVFQNPENQFVSSVVEEDVAFGLENYDTPPNEIPGRVSRALEQVGMTGFEKRSPHLLSGGQKQRIALAGVLAMEPELIVFDEATAMLDPVGREEILECMKILAQRGKTVIMITHYVEEAVEADRVILMNRGTILADGKPQEVLTSRELLEQCGLSVPMPVQLYDDLAKLGIRLGHCPLTKEELVEELCQLN